ncbi:MAG: hypothetical protein ACPMAQ_04825, partial [Phycisphaerae bacterium]
KYFRITVVDEQTGRRVPLVELETTNNIRHYTDSNGIVAFYEPGLMGQSVFFFVRSHGYEFPKDGFGMQGRALDVKEGGSATLKIRRINIAERLYRITGGGIYRDTVLLGEQAPIEQPVLNGKVLGQDSVQNAVYKGRLYWFWGDTNKPSYPLGNFQMTGAVSLLPGDGGLDPSVGVNLAYFTDKDGFTKQMAPVPGEGPCWADAFVTFKDKSGRERMVAGYAKVYPNMEAHERGLLEWNDAKEVFEKVAQFDLHSPMVPRGHPFRCTDAGTEYVYFPAPFPTLRVPADPDRMRDLSSYEAYTCLKEDSRLDSVQLDRDADGRLRYAWRKNAPPMDPNVQETLVKSGHVKPGELLFHLRDAEQGKAIRPHGGSVYWNEYRRRWITIMLEVMGTSMLGEIWFAEADTPLGPWVYARKIVTHDRYDFYNPKQHPVFDQEGGRIIFFEGTYTNTFSGNPCQTPRYNYNQIMYRLDLADPRLALPVPVYNVASGKLPNRFATGRTSQPDPATWRIAFFAPDRAAPGTIPVYAVPLAGAGMRLSVGTPSAGPKEAGGPPLCYALPADMKNPPAATTPLYEFVSEDGAARAYSTDASASFEGYRRSEQALCRVWQSPFAAR